MFFQTLRERGLVKTLPVILLLFSSVVVSAQQGKAISIKQLTDSIQAIVKRDHVPGLMVGITNKDSVLFSGGFGYADVKTKRPADGSTLFRMGSITKMFVSLCILKLVQEGKISLNDELKKVAPEVPFVNEWEATRPVRMVNLLEHTAGFDDMKLNRMCSQDKKEYTGKEMMLFQRHSLVCRWRPGERFAYSNPGYVILGYIIEKITGKPYDQYVSENILLPLVMNHSNCNLYSKLPGADTKQYVVHSGKIIEVPAVTILMAPAGSLWSCADDMVKFLQLFLNNGQPLFQSSIINEMETVHSSLAAKAGLANGYALANENLFLFNQGSWRGHTGLMGTCFSTFAYNRALGLGFIMSSNGNQQNAGIERLIANYLEQYAPRKKPGTVIADLQTIVSFQGQYRFENPRNEISGFKDKLLNTPEVFIENNTVFVKPLFGKQVKLVQTAAGQFAHEGANAATIVFTKNEAGKNVMVMDGNFYEQTSFARVKFAFWLSAMAIFFIVSAALAGIASLTRFISGRLTKDKLMIRILPLLGVLLLVWALVNLLQVQNESYLLSELTKIDTRTLIIFLGTLLFGIFSVLHLLAVLVKFRQFSNRFFAFYWVATALSTCYIAFVLFENGWIGLRTWTM